MGVFTRGDKLWIRFRDVTGWRNAATGYSVGEEAQAEQVLAEVEQKIAAKRGATAVVDGTAGALTLRRYAATWCKGRTNATADDDRSRVYNHVLPVLGDVILNELRPKHIRDFRKALAGKAKLGNIRPDGTRVKTDELLSARSQLHVLATLRRMLADAVADELIPSSPFVLKAGELPRKVDADPTWRRTAVFTRDEVQRVISADDDAVPEDRRTLYAVMFLAGVRFGEAAALRWRDYDPACEPLGKLVVERSYDTKTKLVKGTKTDNPREMPVHPTLAAVLASWKLGGFERLTGRKPEPDDLIVPSRRGAHRSANHMLKRFKEDLGRLGFRVRRQHDTRRTLVSLARADGARADVLRFATHGPTGSVVDMYTTLPWAAVCDEVAKLRVSLLDGEVIELPTPVAAELPDAGSESPEGGVPSLASEAQRLVTSLVTAEAEKRKAPGLRRLRSFSGGGVDGTRTRKIEQSPPRRDVFPPC
jgi:integrase